ncbi:unnamed protein product [Adineta steineri]|uniref:G-protein coupled receptors family 1 profile domain-containing protein n=1 Tax=Adineta steineri TaxID=433720 RepID=A0A815L078_9BILA|nr:unnamed protein product [Adineta steineri]CAF3873700.1 unnamed protein product [Adineta steineri]
MSINNIFYASIGITYNLLLDGYQVDLIRYSRVFCKLISYILNFCPYLSVYMLVLASIDRYCSSSLNAQRRNWSNIRMARKATLIMLIIIAIFMIGILISFDIRDNGSLSCSSTSDSLFNQIYLIMEVIVYVITAPFLMMLFGFLTIYNIYKSNRNLAVAIRYRPSERQLSRMLIIQVLTQIILNLPFCVVFFALILPPTFQSTIMFYFLYVIFKIPFYMTFITPFFLYILSAQVYRDEFIRLLKKIFRIHGERAIHPATTRVMNGSLATNHLPPIPEVIDIP